MNLTSPAAQKTQPPGFDGSTSRHVAPKTASYHADDTTASCTASTGWDRRIAMRRVSHAAGSAAPAVDDQDRSIVRRTGTEGRAPAPAARGGTRSGRRHA